MNADGTHDTTTNTKPVLTRDMYGREGFAETDTSGRIDLGHNNSTQGVIYQMAEKTKTTATKPEGKTWGQVYHEDVEALVASGTSNADAIREVAAKYEKEVNAVRGGIFQYKKSHANGDAPAPTARRSRKASSLSYDDLIGEARKALEAARDLIDQEVNEAKTALDAAQARYDTVVASVKDRKADIEKKLTALA
jgi:hypothetical protein